MIKRLSVALSGLLLGLCAPLLVAEARQIDPDQLHFRRLSVKDGLPSAYINTLLERQDGFLWIGTKGGLSRFDGQYFHNFGYSRETGLLSNDITALYETPAGQLWVGGTNGAYLYREAGNQFIHLPLLDRPVTVLAFAQQEPERLWIGTDLGLFLVSTADYSVVREIREPHVRWLSVLDGQLWVAGATGLFRYDLAQQQLHKIALDGAPGTEVRHQEIYDVAQLGNQLWLATRRDGLLIFDLASQQVEQQLLRAGSWLQSNNVWSLSVRGTQLWLGYFYDGLHRFNSQDGRHQWFTSDPQIDHSLPYNNVSDLLFDRSDNLWVATTNGLAVADLDSAAIRHLGRAENITDRHIWSVARREDQLWFGSENGLNRLDLTRNQLTTYTSNEREDGLPRTVIWSLLPQQAQVYLGTNRGLLLFDPATETVSRPMAVPEGAAVSAGTEVYSLRQLDDQLLLGFSNGALGFYDLASRTLTGTVPDAVPSYVTDMEPFAGGIVVTGRRGLGFVQGSQVQAIVPDSRIDWAESHFNAVLAANGLLWVASNNAGLFALRRDAAGQWQVVHQLTQAQGLDSEQIKGLVQTGEHSLWVSTSRSLFRLSLADLGLQNYHSYLHWLDMEFNDNAVPQSVTSLLALGGNQGLVVIDPQALTPSQVLRQVKLTSLQIMEQEFTHLADPALLVIKPDETFYSFNFSVLEFFSPDMIRYQYQLAPVDQTWRDMKGSQLSLSRLPYGDYVLSVRASGVGEQSLMAPFVLPLRVQPPPWLSTPAKVAYGVLVLGLLVLWLVLNRKRISAITYMARHDSLTGLPNRAYLAGELAQRLQQARERGHRLAVVFLDLNGFKAINDTYGHKAGDQLLVHVAQQMSASIRHGDFLARQSGDEFVLLLDFLQSTGDMERALNRVLAAFNTDFRVAGQLIAYGSSVGISVFEGARNGISAEQLLHQADVAMYHSKQTRAPYSVYGRDVSEPV